MSEFGDAVRWAMKNGFAMVSLGYLNELTRRAVDSETEVTQLRERIKKSEPSWSPFGRDPRSNKITVDDVRVLGATHYCFECGSYWAQRAGAWKLLTERRPDCCDGDGKVVRRKLRPLPK